MDEIFVSFYHRHGNLRVSRKALRSLGEPKFIRFLLSKDGKSMLMQPYNRKVFQSMRVPKGIYEETEKNSKMQISCIPFCRMMLNHMGWDERLSYRVPGKIYSAQKLVKFDLTKSVVIANNAEEAQDGAIV